MDGVSVAASLLGIGAIGSQVAIKLYTLGTQIGTASDRINSISKDVSFTSSILQQLGELITQNASDDGTSIFSQVALDTTRASAAMCEEIFKAIEKVAKDASDQIRRRGTVVGKIKLSRFEKAKWPFLQPSIETLKNDLSEAKGTLMLMLQVTSLALSKKMTDVHQTTTTHIMEERGLVHAFLELSKRTQAKDDSGPNGPSMDPLHEVTPKPALKISMSRRELPLPEPSIPDEVASSVMNRQVLASIPKHRVPNSAARGRTSTSEDVTSSSNFQHCRCSTVEAGTIQIGTDHVADLSICTGSNCTPSESSGDEYSTGNRLLELHLLKPVVQDHVDMIQLSWNVHNILLPQAEIHKQITKEQREAVFEIYKELYTHEHRAIEHAMTKASTSTSLKSLKRNKVDLWHREISFQGVPTLEFVLERDVQRTVAGAQAACKIESKRPIVVGKDKSGYRNMDLGDFLEETSLVSCANELDETPDPPSNMPKYELEAAEPASLPFIGYSSFKRFDATLSKPHWQSSSGFGGPGEPPQSHRRSLVDLSTRQNSPSSTMESQKFNAFAFNGSSSSKSYQSSSEQEEPTIPTQCRDRDLEELFKDDILFRTLNEDLDNMQQAAARISVDYETSKRKPTEPRSRELRRKPALLFPPRRDSFSPTGRDGRELPLSMTGLEECLPRTPQSNWEAGTPVRFDSIDRAGRARHRTEMIASSSMESREHEASSDTSPSPLTPPVSKSVSSAAPAFRYETLSGCARPVAVGSVWGLGPSIHDQNSRADSPRHGIALSVDNHEDNVHTGISALPVLDDSMPEIGHGLDSDSDLDTNPSIIQGPIGDNRDHWPYQPTPPPFKGEFASKTTVAEDSDDEYGDVSVEAVDEEEADIIVRILLEKYTTLFQSPEARTKSEQST